MQNRFKIFFTYFMKVGRLGWFYRRHTAVQLHIFLMELRFWNGKEEKWSLLAYEENNKVTRVLWVIHAVHNHSYFLKKYEKLLLVVSVLVINLIAYHPIRSADQSINTLTEGLLCSNKLLGVIHLWFRAWSSFRNLLLPHSSCSWGSFKGQCCMMAKVEWFLRWERPQGNIN